MPPTGVGGLPSCDPSLNQARARHSPICSNAARRAGDSPALRKAIRAELDHDLVRLSVAEIEERLTAA